MPRSKNPGAPRTYRLQKVVSRLEKQPSPQVIKAGMIASSPQQLVGDTLADYLDKNVTESFLILHIDIKNRIIGYTEFNSGGTAGVEVHAAGVFRDALGAGAAAVLTVHNHPSGDPTPSAEDKALWSRLRSAGEIIGVPVLDNLVVGENGRFYSESADSIDQATHVRRHAAEKRSRA